ncbi:MAG TPA: hypothetical protein VHO24_07535 [Opitutaceae bacterium]|nr:hypothetical protein [Opitutaceae bacterium]
MKIVAALVLVAAASVALFAAEKKALTNADVIKMVKADLPESTVLLAIQASQPDFDTSVDALIELKTNRVPAKVIDAMLQPAAAPSAAAGPAPDASAEASPPAAETPEQKTGSSAFILNAAGEKKRLPSTPFKIVETKAKGNTMGKLLAESAVTDVARDMVVRSAMTAMMSSGNRFVGSMGGVAGNVGGMLGKKMFKTDEVTLTYVCAMDGPQSENTLAADAARFEINFADVTGADPNDFQPVLLKISPTPKNWRLVGAIKAKKSEYADPSQASAFSVVEERIPVTAKKLGRGHVEIKSTNPLPPGEYAVVLRPVDTGKKIILQELETEQGEGAVLRTVWDFSVPAAVEK